MAAPICELRYCQWSKVKYMKSHGWKENNTYKISIKVIIFTDYTSSYLPRNNIKCLIKYIRSDRLWVQCNISLMTYLSSIVVCPHYTIYFGTLAIQSVLLGLPISIQQHNSITDVREMTATRAFKKQSPINHDLWKHKSHSGTLLT